ncbi:MAG: ABC transporter ATP-binding protein [Variovorax sp.]
MTLQDIHKTYGSGAQAHHALRGVSLALADGEFIALLGPSGSGKTTLLRTIAGLEPIDSGEIRIGSDLVSSAAVLPSRSRAAHRHVPPEQRQVSVVFQSHALWPHMTVHDNVAFPLRQGATPVADIDGRVRLALAAVELDELSGRFPSQLSGGQRQRVALARAMVGAPRVLLFDEPLASLDTELRRDMMRQIAKARRSDMPMVYVTHNQEEALALADRIAVLADGQIVQLAQPHTLCQEPASAAIAAFVGGGNVLDADVVRALDANIVVLSIRGYEFPARCRALPATARVQVCISPAAVSLTIEAQALEVRATFIFFQGLGQLVETDLPRSNASFFMCVLPMTARPSKGDLLRLQVHDAWVIPETV